jgi:adenylate cyclase
LSHAPARPSAEAIREAVARIVSSPDFESSGRNRRFLGFVVEETLAGRADRIKAYAIATGAFGRAADFDPQNDPIVRIEALRLRRSLERYYLLAGRDDPIRITIPKGTYIPSFTLAGADDEASMKVVAAPRPVREPNPSIRVDPFEGDCEGGPLGGRGFTRHLVCALSRFSYLDVYGGVADLHEGPAGGDLRGREVDYVLTGAVTVDDHRFAAEALLTDARSGRHIWGETREKPLHPAALHAARDELADNVARLVAQPWGLIHAARAREAWDRPPEQMTTYDCVNRFYSYRRSYDRAQHGDVLACLERVVAAEPSYAEAIACLSLAYTDAARFGYGAGARIDPIRRAHDLAERAINLAPHSSRSNYALGMALWFAGEVAGAFAALEAAHRLNPNDTEIMADLGVRYCNHGQPEHGKALVLEAYARNPALPGVFCVGLAVDAYLHGRYEEAISYARRMMAPTVVYGPLMIAAAAARLGRFDEAANAIAQVLQIDPAYGEKVGADLAARNIEPRLAGDVIAALRLAGLPGGGGARLRSV